MSASAVFAVGSQLVVPGWLLLVFAPRWSWTHRIVFALAAAYGVAYVTLFASQVGRIEGGFGSLAEVSLLFENENLLTAGWLHYLAFDLFVGGWIARDAARSAVSHFLVIPCLLLTFLLGPSGLLAYLAIRAIRTRTFLPLADHE